jgi:hypothetical protein
MNDSRDTTIGEATVSGRMGANPSSAGSQHVLPVITALNLIRMNLGMYPPGHTRIAESIDYTFDMIQKLLRQKNELLIGFAGDTLSFGETATDKENKSSAFQDYARCLNHLRIVAFTLHRGFKKQDLLEFNRILSAKPADIWAMGKIESVFERAGITGIKVKVIDADHFRLEEKKELTRTRVDPNVKDEHFWEGFFAHLKAETLKRRQDGGLPPDQGNMDAAEAIRFLNKQREQWPSAVLSYEKMVHGYFSDISKGMPAGIEKLQTLTSVNSLSADLHPDLRKQMIDVVERQLAVHPNTALVADNLKCFPQEMFREIIRQTSERGSQISPALVNLLKKMTGSQDAQVSTDPEMEKDFSSADMQTLLNREKYEKYVPEDYDRILKKAAATPFSGEGGDESPFPVDEYLKTLTHEAVDFRICRFIHSLMDRQITDEEYFACYGKLTRSIPELLRGGQFPFLTSLMETLHRHAREKPSEPIRQKALSLLRSLMDKETIARHVAPFILHGAGNLSEMKTFLISSGVQNLSWLFDLYLDPKGTSPTTIIETMKGFGRNTTEEAVKRIPGRDSRTIVRLLTLIREMADRSVVSSLKNLFHHEDWKVRREVIKTLAEFGDPAVIGLLRKSLKAENHEEVLEAVSLACRYRVNDFLEDLTSMLKSVVIRKESVRLNEWIVGELAKTKNPSVIPYLERIAAAWFSFSPKHLARMKVALYRNLNHFPKNQIRKLLQKGYRSRNKEIRMACAKILKKARNDEG